MTTPKDTWISVKDAIEFAKWLQHIDNGDVHFDPFTKTKSASIGYSPSDCLQDEVYSVEELFEKWMLLPKPKPTN